MAKGKVPSEMDERAAAPSLPQASVTKRPAPRGFVLSSPYDPTRKETEAMQRLIQRQWEAKAVPSFRVSERDGEQSIAVNHPAREIGECELMEALGTASTTFAKGLSLQLANLTQGDAGTVERNLNFALASITGLQPRDEAEAMLAAQMVAVHEATMSAARRLRTAETLNQFEAQERALNRLARTYAAQMDALKKYRTKGEQKVTVEHVHVHEGGQAIVGNVTAGGRVSPAKPEATP